MSRWLCVQTLVFLVFCPGCPHTNSKAYIPFALVICKPIFHLNANGFASGPRVGLDPQGDDFTLLIPTC